MPSSHSSLVSLFLSRFFPARGFWKKDGFRNCETVIATVTRGSDDGDDDDDDDDDLYIMVKCLCVCVLRFFLFFFLHTSPPPFGLFHEKYKISMCFGPFLGHL